MYSKTKLNEVRQESSFKGMLDYVYKEGPDKIAYEFKENKTDKKKTYKEFIDDTRSLGTALNDIGMSSKHVAVIGENSYKWITVYLTMLQASGVLVPVDKELTEDAIINVLKHSDSEVLFYASKFEDMIENIKKAVPEVKYFIGFDKSKDDKTSLSYNKFLEKGAKLLKDGNTKFLDETSDPNVLKLLVYTSGTTGNPKGVMLTEHNLLSIVNYGLQVTHIGPKGLSVLPYHHTYEAVAGILVAIHEMSDLCINDSLKNVLKNLNTYKPDYIYLVPAFTEVFYKNIWANAKKTGKDKVLKIMIPVSNALRKVGIDLRRKLFKSIHEAFGGNLNEIVCGGAPIRPEIGKFFNDIGIVLYNGYGITECSPLVSVNNDTRNDSNTVGHILPCCEVKFENITDDGDGEIWIKGDIVMLGYYKEQEKTDRVLVDGWFNTEDYGRLNKYGQLVINGRKKNIIVLENGKNVYPEEIENIILGIPYIKEVIVKGRKNKYKQDECLIAEVFLDDEKVKELNSDDIKETLKTDVREACKNLPLYKKIADIEIRETEFDKTTTNKIKR